jgi:hypothetical protein
LRLQVHIDGGILSIPHCFGLTGSKAIKLLLQHGAMWKPEPSTLNDTRRILYKIEIG